MLDVPFWGSDVSGRWWWSRGRIWEGHWMTDESGACEPKNIAAAALPCLYMDPRRDTWRNRPSLAETDPARAEMWADENGDVTPWMVCAFSNKPRFWKCLGHVWESTPAKVSAGRGCGICAFKVLLVGFNDLATTNPELKHQLDPIRNGGLTASMVIGGQSNKSYTWTCHVENRSDHYWDAPVYARTGGSGCGVCACKVLLAGFNDLATTNPELVCQFLAAKNGGLTASMVLGGSSDETYIWTCDLGHDWPAKVGTRTRGKGCGVCACRVLLVGFNDLATTNPELICQLDPAKNGGLTAAMIIGGKSNKRRTWTCVAGQGHGDWPATVSNRTAGTGCGKCSQLGTSKVERALLQTSVSVLDSVSGGVKLRVEWRKSRSMLVDIVGTFRGRPVAVEYDGLYYHLGASKRNRDTDKTRALLAAGYLVVRIRDCGLEHLDVDHPDLFQIDHPYRFGCEERLRADLVPTVDVMAHWLDVRASATVDDAY